MERDRTGRTKGILSSSWMTAAVVLITVVFLSVNWYYYRRTRASLDREFGIRLESLAALAAASVDPGDLDLLEPGLGSFERSDSLQVVLARLCERFSLAGVHILREDGVVLLSTRPDLFPPGDLYPLWGMDAAQIVAALEGRPVATGLYRSPGGGSLKAGYAPVARPGEEAIAVAAVEADAGFLSGLQDLRTILIFATTLSAAGLVVFVWFASIAARSLVRARESLLHAETLASMGRMTAGIAHEIRNPLFIIRGAAERLKSSHPESAAEIDDLIVEEVDRLDAILTDYLLFARNETAPKQKIDLVNVLRRSIRLLERSEEAEGIVIETELEMREAPVYGEEKRLQQVFLNILLNAIQATVGEGRIDVRLGRTASNFVVRFSDTGRGIPEKDRERIFEPFYTTRPAGSGLGLAVARRVITDHGGTIEAGSRPGGGTVVTVTLPAHRPGEGENR
jgi:signal transduction histidine kinase